MFQSHGKKCFATTVTLKSVHFCSTGYSFCSRYPLQATRDYAIGEAPEPSAVAAAESFGCEIQPGFAARKFDYEQDTVNFDLVLVMDKFTAGDVMREVLAHPLKCSHPVLNCSLFYLLLLLVTTVKGRRSCIWEFEWAGLD